MQISPDNSILWQKGFISLNCTILFTWLVMFIMTFISWLVTRCLSSDVKMTRGQNLLESIVTGIVQQIRGVNREKPEQLLPFLGTLFLFIAICNLLSIVPGFKPPTGSLSTTAALALIVFVSIPCYGISHSGLKYYLGNYIRPSLFMLPFNIMSEISRTMALAVRLFGNIMSGSMIAAILLSLAPLVLPVIMQAFGLLTGLVQAYIFAVLAAVYITAGFKVHGDKKEKTGIF